MTHSAPADRGDIVAASVVVTVAGALLTLNATAIGLSTKEPAADRRVRQRWAIAGRALPGI
jgi:hypothetical protein